MSRRLPTSSVVWIVEDHPDLRMTLQEALEVSACGHVEAFASCEASVERVADPDTPRRMSLSSTLDYRACPGWKG